MYSVSLSQGQDTRFHDHDSDSGQKLDCGKQHHVTWTVNRIFTFPPNLSQHCQNHFSTTPG